MSSKQADEVSAKVDDISESSEKTEGTVACFWSSTAADCETLSR
jgi:hypothetical protein